MLTIVPAKYLLDPKVPVKVPVRVKSTCAPEALTRRRKEEEREMGGVEESGLTAPNTTSVPYASKEFEKVLSFSNKNKRVGIRLT